MLNVGVSQIKNSIEIEENILSIKRSLKSFEDSPVDLILFPECSLSGFSAKMKDCSLNILRPYLDEINRWSVEHNKMVVLPCAVVEGGIYNSGFVFQNNSIERFYKIGLTESEKKFFSLSLDSSNKIFSIKGYSFSILICFEVEMSPWQFFAKGSTDFILWPGYWGWEKSDTWKSIKKNHEKNLVFENMNTWKMPLIQSNFSFNSLPEFREKGPHGLSVFVNRNNELVGQADYDEESCYIVSLDKDDRGAFIKTCEKIL